MGNKINILIHGLGNNFAGGVETFIINYVRNIDKDIFQIDFICYDNKPAYYGELINMGSRVHIVTGRRKNYFSCCKQINEVYKKNSYNIVWSNVCSLSDIFVLKYAFIHNIQKRIVHSHNSSVRRNLILTCILHKIHKKEIHKYATDFWACSYTAGQFMYPEFIIKSNRFRIIHNAINTEKFVFNKSNRLLKRKEFNLDDKLVIGHIGRFHFQKNHEFILQVFAKIYKKRPEAILLLVGDGSLSEKIKMQADVLGFKENVLLTGARMDIAELLHIMDIFLFPSHYEGLPFVLIEAQATGLQCFISDVITPEVIITDTVYPISLNEPAISWADKIIYTYNAERKDNSLSIRKRGYDIQVESKKLESYFLEGINDH